MAQPFLDPELIANDPSLNFLFSLNAGPPQPAIPEDDEEFPEAVAPGFAPAPQMTNTAGTSSYLESFGNLVKCHKKFMPESEAEFDDFCTVMLQLSFLLQLT